MLDERELSRLIAAGESETLDFKEKPTEKMFATLAAFANQQGGTLLIGVTDTGTVKGWSASESDFRGLANSISDQLRIQPSIERIQAGENMVTAVHVTPSVLPVAYEGRYYKRVGNTTCGINPEELGRFLVNKIGVTWDSIPGDYPYAEFDIQTIQEFVSIARKRLPYLDPNEAPEQILRKLDLLKNRKPARGAMLLFGINPQSHFLTSQVHIGRFKGDNTVIDDKMLRGNLFQLLKQVMQLLQQYLQVHFEIGAAAETVDPLDLLRRHDKWDYPLDALREALLNALVHRDYFVSTGEIEIRVYDDRIIISNPGELPQAITIDELRQAGHRSIPRNPLMAQVLYYAGLIEKWGTGTTRIIELCMNSGLPSPQFKSEKGWFQIGFLSGKLNVELLEKAGLAERQIAAIKQLKEVPRITVAQYAKQAGVSLATAKRDITDLISRGILIKRGTTGRGVYYVFKGTEDLPLIPVSPNSSETAQTAHKQLINSSLISRKGSRKVVR